MSVMRRWFPVPIILLSLLSCGEAGEDEGQDFGNLFDGPSGIILSRDEHEEGWGRSACLSCHPVEEIHRVDRTGSGVLPLKDIREFVARAGLESCPVCHGDNGVTK
jgi:hypothetical protein